MASSNITQAYTHCQNIAARHYENFPVASWLLPKHLRQPITVIYSFARTADDFADEGNYSPLERHQLLDDYTHKVENPDSSTDDPIFVALTDVIHKFKLPTELFTDLISAFKMDIDNKRYANFDEVLNYCHFSANPVGRLLLYLYNAATPENLEYSDAICTALQLINFYQDLSQDYQENNRIYLPTNEMDNAGVSEFHIANRISDQNMQQFMQKQYQRCRELLETGLPLGTILKGRIGFEMRMIIAGGFRILNKLENNPNVFSRPRLNKQDMLVIFFNSMHKKTLNI